MPLKYPKNDNWKKITRTAWMSLRHTNTLTKRIEERKYDYEIGRLGHRGREWTEEEEMEA